jgi:adenylate kinase
VIVAKDIRLILFGAPGSGKGTQATLLSEEFEIDHISTGDMLRKEVTFATPLGLEIKSILSSGALVSDEIVFKLVEQKIALVDSFIIDGFPRTLNQGNIFVDILNKYSKPLTLAIYLEVDEDEILQRIVERSKVEERVDDSVEIVKERLRIFNRDTLPVVNFFDSMNVLRRVNGMNDIDKVSSDIKNFLSEKI